MPCYAFLCYAMLLRYMLCCADLFFNLLEHMWQNLMSCPLWMLFRFGMLCAAGTMKVIMLLSLHNCCWRQSNPSSSSSHLSVLSSEYLQLSPFERKASMSVPSLNVVLKCPKSCLLKIHMQDISSVHHLEKLHSNWCYSASEKKCVRILVFPIWFSLRIIDYMASVVSVFLASGQNKEPE